MLCLGSVEMDHVIRPKVNNVIQGQFYKGAQWLSGKVLDSRPRVRVYPASLCCVVVSLSKTHLSLLSTGSTQENLSRHNWKIVDWDVKNQIKQNNLTKKC